MWARRMELVFEEHDIWDFVNDNKQPPPKVQPPSGDADEDAKNQYKPWRKYQKNQLTSNASVIKNRKYCI